MVSAQRRVSLRSAPPLAAIGLLAAMAGCSGDGGRMPGMDRFGGSYILTLSDADMPATAFYDDRLEPRPPGARDALTIVPLPFNIPRREGEIVQTPVAQAAVSNSAIGPPDALAISPDGRTAFVVESRGPAPEGAAKLEELPVGETVTAIDLSSPLEPRVLGSAFVGTYPTAAAVHPTDNILAVITGAERKQLVLARFEPGAGFTGDPMAWPLLGLDDDGASASSVSWHRSGRYLAVTLPRRDEVMFYEFTRGFDDPVSGERIDALAVAPWGNPVKVGKYPYSGRFTPDGNHFITTDLYWGADVEGFNVGAPPGRLSVIRLSDVESVIDLEQGDAVHQVVSTATVGISPEGLAITPDGRFIVTANLRGGFLPEGHERFSDGGSLTLLRFDAPSGQLTPLAEYAMNAMPEGIAFDADGRFLTVTQFRSFDPAALDGELSFWWLKRGSSPELRQAEFFLGVGKGPHGVLVAP